MSTKTAEYNWKRLEQSRDAYKDALEGSDVPLIADVVLQAGYHPYAGGKGLLEILVRRHRGQAHPPLAPQITQTDVVQLADELGINPQFAPTRRLDI